MRAGRVTIYYRAQHMAGDRHCLEGRSPGFWVLGAGQEVEVEVEVKVEGQIALTIRGAIEGRDRQLLPEDEGAREGRHRQL